MSVKIVYNACYGGFGLSDKAIRRYAEIKRITLYPEDNSKYDFTTYWTKPQEERDNILSSEEFMRASMDQRQESNEAYDSAVLEPREIERTDPALVQVVEELGKYANSRFSDLQIETLEKGQKYVIDEYDGLETIVTIENTNWLVA